MRRFLLLTMALFGTLFLFADGLPHFSTAGFFEMQNSGRSVYSMNIGWRFLKSDVLHGASSVNFDDADWQIVSLPHGLEVLPQEASGCANYQGVVWYRKHFKPMDSLKGKNLFLYFEAIMGKSEVYINGKLAKKFYGGYLPIVIDVTKSLIWGADNVIAVKADNSNDSSYPVGKPQNVLDFTYFGGIYRDCWLVAHNDVFISDPNYEDEVAGGGVFVAYDNVSKQNADVILKAHIRNSSAKKADVKVVFDLKDKSGDIVKTITKPISVDISEAGYVNAKMNVKSPHLWSPDSPYLYNLCITVKDKRNKIIDGYRLRIGIRSIEFKQESGLWINGEPYKGKIMGTNRHQDFAVLGNALPNSLQWRDAKKLRDADMKVIRTHYVIDPAFMDACDELGLFALVETPGWQFWNNDSVFGARVYHDIRNMIRLHRNHPSLFFWEPILNETSYPESFAKKAAEICREEYPYPYSEAACDDGAAGDQYFSLLLRPQDVLKSNKTYFIREWGDNVDDWNAHNSDSRVAREWGETPMLIQAAHYASPNYPLSNYGGVAKAPTVLCYDNICSMPRQIVGACFWHSFDHQRGYHADPFYGGMMDAFRQPKYSYYMFQSQRPPVKSDLIAETGPMVYIANELTPFSPKDITVYSNCDEVRLTVFEGGKQYVYKKDKNRTGMPSPVITFEDAFHFMDWKFMARARKQDNAYLLAEGLMDGKVVATHKRFPSGQVYRIRLRLDNENVPLVADGSDAVVVVAEMVDKRGTVKRLNNSYIKFQIEGEASLIADERTATNPLKVAWGSACVLVKATTKPGKIKVIASMLNQGSNRPLDGVLEFASVPDEKKEIYSESELQSMVNKTDETKSRTMTKSDLERENEQLKKELQQLKVLEVEKQQTKFGKGIND